MGEQNNVNKTVLLAVTMTSSFFNPFLGSAVNVALPILGKEFSLTSDSLSWIAMAFLLSSAIFAVPFGKISDIVGRKRIFLIGNIILLFGSVFCIFSSNGLWLISFRFIQGIGSAMIFSSSLAMVLSAFPPQKRGTVIGYNVFAVYSGLSMAPFLGGIITEYIGWRSLFFINAVACVIIIFGVLTKIKDDWTIKTSGKFDYLGSVLYMFSLPIFMFGFTKIQEPYAKYLMIVGALFFILFLKTELKSKMPVLEIRLFVQNRVFAFSNFAALINYAATFAVGYILSLFLQYVNGMSPKVAGGILMAQPVMMAMVALFSGRMSDKMDPGILSSVGMTISTIGLTMLAFISENSTHWYIISCLLVLGFGFGLFSSPNTNAVMGSVEKTYLGVASATVSTMRLIGQMFSMAVAAMVIHLYIGKAKITISNIPEFLKSAQILFAIFSVLCFVGIFASLARGKKQVN